MALIVALLAAKGPGLIANKPLKLTGVSSGSLKIQAFAGQRVIAVDNGHEIATENLTVTGGHPSGALGCGIFVINGSLTLINVRIAVNSADYGGGALHCLSMTYPAFPAKR